MIVRDLKGIACGNVFIKESDPTKGLKPKFGLLSTLCDTYGDRKVILILPHGSGINALDIVVS